MKNPIPIDRLAVAAMGKQSSLYVWMMQNHDDFAKVVADSIHPDWDGLAKEFGANGVVDGKGNPPSGTIVRHTWWRVRKAIAARRKADPKRAASPQSPAASPSRQSATPIPQPPSPDDFMPMEDPDDDAKPRFVIRKVT